MNPFNLQAALAGDPVITRSGQEVLRIVHFPEFQPQCRLVVLIKGETAPCYFHEDGKFYRDNDIDLDLFMAPKKVKYYFASYRPDNYSGYRPTTCLYDSEERLKLAAPDFLSYSSSKIHEIEIEE